MSLFYKSDMWERLKYSVEVLVQGEEVYECAFNCSEQLDNSIQKIQQFYI